MEKIKFEEMTPEELIAAQKEKSVVFLPVGSMEWHGPHMGMGMDTKNAYSVAVRTARETGGAVMPPLYIGTESKRSRDTLVKLGFKGDENIIGMDFPKNTIKSMYWEPELFEKIIESQVKFLIAMGYKLIVIVNGHGADIQIDILDKICKRNSIEGEKSIISIMILFEDCGVGIGHAGLAETAIMEAICPEGVDISRLPAKPQALLNTDYAIVDNETFTEGPNEDFSVRYDPRDASPELGERLISFAVGKCAYCVETEYKKLNK